MDDAIRKTRVLVEALGWIRQFRDRYVVIKLGGSALDDVESVRRCLNDVVFMEAVGMRPILIHGGGKAISRAMKDSGIEARFVQGRRYTDYATLDIVTNVLANDLCESLADQIRTLGGKAVGLHLFSQNVLIGEQLKLADEQGGEVDLGRVGHVTGLNRDLLSATCRAGTIPVLPSIALDATGKPLNVNADTAAAAVARLLSAEKLVFLSDVPGIFLDRNDPTTLQSHLTVKRCRELIAEGIIDARIPHSILLEIYSDTGIGTEIVK